MNLGDVNVDLTVNSRQFREALAEPLLGLATTRQLLEELKVRGEVEPRYQDEGNALAIGAARLLDDLPGSMLDYRTVDS